MDATMSGRRVAAIGLVAAATVIAGVAVWLLRTRAAPLPPPVSAANRPGETETPMPPPVEAAPPLVAHRRKKPPEPYLPPYEPAPHLTEGLVHPVMEEVEIHFPRLFGKVVSAVDGTPVCDAVVGVPNEFESGREHEEYVLNLDDVRQVARTDGDGRFELAESVVGSSMTVSAAGCGPQFFDRGWLGQSREEPFIIEVFRSAKFAARVTDRSGAPKPGVEVRLIADAYAATPRRDLPIDRILLLLVGSHRSTDELGEATIAQLPPGVPFDVELWSGGTLMMREPYVLVFESGKEVSKEWRLGSGSTVSGRVVDDAEEPVSGQTLWLTQYGVFLHSGFGRASLYQGDRDRISRVCTTDRDGRFKIEDVGPGHWWLGIEPETDRFGQPVAAGDRSIAPVAEAFDVDARGRPVDLLLRVYRGLYIRGKTVGPDGRPVVAHVSAFSVGSEIHFAANECTNSGPGEFVLGPLEPGEYRLRGEPISWDLSDRSRPIPGRPLAPNDALIVPAGRDGVVIEFGHGAAVRVRATRADDGVVVSATFLIAHAESSDWFMWGGFGEGTTTAEFSCIEPGDYVLSAVTHDGRAGGVRNLHLAAGERRDEVIIRVEPGAHVNLRYVGPKEEYAIVTILADGIVYGGDGIRTGTSSTLVAPAGKVTIRWSAGKDHFDEEVELMAGETREIVWPRTEMSDAPGQDH